MVSISSGCGQDVKGTFKGNAHNKKCWRRGSTFSGIFNVFREWLAQEATRPNVERVMFGPSHKLFVPVIIRRHSNFGRSSLATSVILKPSPSKPSKWYVDLSILEFWTSLRIIYRKIGLEIVLETLDRKADFWMVFLAPQESQGAQGGEHRFSRSPSRRGRARIWRSPHLRLLQRHIRPYHRSFWKGDHFPCYWCVST